MASLESESGSAAPAKRAKTSHATAPLVFRFRVTEIYDCTSMRLKPDLGVSVTSEQGLYTVLEKTFEERVDEEAIYSHLFTCSLAGKKYSGPFGHGEGGRFWVRHAGPQPSPPPAPTLNPQLPTPNSQSTFHPPPTP